MTDIYANHYKIAISIKPEEVPPWQKLYGGTIDVDCKVAVYNATPEVADRVSFLLYRLLQVEGIFDETERELPFEEKVIGLKQRPRQQVRMIQASLLSPIAPGETTEIHIKYHGAICGYPEIFPYVQDHVSSQYTLLRTDVFWHPVIGMPENGFPERPFTFEITASVPEDWIVLANGELVNRDRQSGFVRYHWQSTHPEAWGHLTLACAPFQQLELTPSIHLYYLKEDCAGAQIVARAIEQTIQRCTAWFGPIPTHFLSIVEIPERYGSEACRNLILQTADTFRANDIKAYQQALSWAGHEVIHLWNTPSREEQVTRFLDEGITHYFEALLLREEISEVAYWTRMEKYKAYFLSGGEEALSIPLADAGKHINVRDVLARGKGPWLLCVLHHILDDKLLSAIRDFFNEYREQGATLGDFQRKVMEVTDLRLEQFFQDWFYSADSSKWLVRETEAPGLVEEIVKNYA
jgi:hypothetical protein